MSTIINARSPYFIKYDNSGTGSAGNAGDIAYAEIAIFIYSGENPADQPSDPTYEITKEVNGSDLFVVVEISELIRDYLQTEYYNEAIDAVWVDIVTQTYDSGDREKQETTDTYLAIDGFGYFPEGSNPRTSTDPTNTNGYTPMVLQTNMCVPFVRGRDIKIPVFSEAEPDITTTIPLGVWNYVDDFWENADVNWNSTAVDLTISDSDDSADKIQYVIISSDNAVTGETITFTSTVGNAQTQTITVFEICEPRYEAFRGIFYNKFGALQTFWFPKKSIVKTDAKSEEYKAIDINYSNATTNFYNTAKHNKKRFDVIAKQMITLNTGLIDECLNDPIEQLLMAEQIWIEDAALSTFPVIIRFNSLTRKTGVNNKAETNHTIEFEFAYDTIQNVR